MSRNSDFLADIGAEPDRSARVTKMNPPIEEDFFEDGPSLASVIGLNLAKFAYANGRELVVGITVLALIGGASINTIFLQDSKHPAPIFGVSNLQTASTKLENHTSEIVLEQIGDEKIADPVVREIQAHLAARGYYDSEIDGLIGARTRAAIALYQRANNEPVTNEPSRQLLEHIRLSRPDEAYHVAARRRVAEKERASGVEDSITQLIQENAKVIEDRTQIKKIQVALASLGYKKVTPDGVVGPITREAVVNFKKKRGLKGDDRITTALLDELTKMNKL